jgi:hypothetical protein
MLGLFLLLLVGQSVAGHRHANEERVRRGEPRVAYVAYLASGEFLSATMENWESEFLQMAAYVVFTTFLFQRGSAESKKIGEPEAVDRDPRLARDKRSSPYPVRRGGLLLGIYENSLSLAFLALFAASFALHAVGSARDFREEHHQSVSVWQHLRGSEFWFESLQNWQSEFLAIGSMVVLSIFLRQRGSPESKPVDAPHRATGSE